MRLQSPKFIYSLHEDKQAAHMTVTTPQLYPLKFLELAGFNQQEILALASIGKEADSNEQATKEKSLVHLLPAAVTLRGDASYALQLGQIDLVPYLGFFGYALQSCSNLRQVLNLLLRYHPLIVRQDIRWELHETDDLVTARFTITIGSLDQKRLMAELVFSNFFTVAKYLSGESFAAEAIHLQYLKPNHSVVYKKYLPAPLKFEQPYNQIIISKTLLDLPVKTANPANYLVFQQQCEEMLRDLNRIENTSTAVRRLLMREAGVFPNIDQVAEQLHMSKSTLGRRLDSEATSFRTITDEVKNLLAKEYLTNTGLTVTDIAHLLDYTDTANFRRAFVRWNKMPPSEFSQVADAKI
jgi:AraC-like DNA-binding protein